MNQAGKASERAPTAATAGAARGASSGGATGAAEGEYIGRLSSLLRANTVFAIPTNLQGNPKATFLVSVQPDCTINKVQLTRSSGVPAWDEAAERGIKRTDPLPRRPDGTCPSELEIVRGPRDER